MISTRIHELAVPLRSRLRRYGGTLRTYCIVFLLGVVVNDLTNQPARGALGTLNHLLGPSLKVLNVLCWLAVVLFILIFLGLRWLGPLSRDAIALHRYLEVQGRFIQSGYAHLFEGSVAWGTCCTLQLAPYLREGWTVDQVNISKQTSRFVFPKGNKSAYDAYLESESKKLRPDGPKFALRGRPFSLTDSPELDLSVAPCRFSEVQFFRDRVASSIAQRDQHVMRALSEQIEFPNALCLHLIIVTADGLLLLAKRSDRLSYNPGVWSLSVEEQMSEQDLTHRPKQMMRAWAARLLTEELGLPPDDVAETDVRVLSVFIEADILNCALAAVAYLPLRSSDLETVLHAGMRPDGEIGEFILVSEADLIQELRRPSRVYHTSTQYRMLLFLASRSSFPAVVRSIAAHERMENGLKR